MAQSKYFRWEAPRRRQDTGDSVSSGLAAGLAAGKLVGSLASAFGDMQKNAIANKLMNTEDAPRAALVSPGGQTVTTGGDESDTGPGPIQDLGPLPSDISTFTNPSTGNVEPLQGQQDTSDTDLASAVAAARLTGSSSNASTVGSLPMASTPRGPTTKFVPNVIPAGVSTAGTAPHRGGTDEMQLQKEMLAFQLQKAQGARAAAEEADKEAERQGTGRFALRSAKERLELAKLQAEVKKAGRPEKPDKDAPPENIDSEPVRDTDQLSNYVDKQYGKDTYSSLVNQVSSSSSSKDDLAVAPPDPNAPKETNPDGTTKETPPPSIYQSNPDGTPKYNPDGTRAFVPGVTVPVQVSKDKTVNMPIAEAQTYIRQTNLQRLRQGLPPFRVPGEEQDVGATPNKPFIARNKLEAQSRAPGTYVRLPSGQVVLWQGLKRTR